MVVLVVISGNELILGMSLIKMLKRIGTVLIPEVLHINWTLIRTCFHLVLRMCSFMQITFEPRAVYIKF